MTAKLTLDFENLPLVEAAVRVSFQTAVGLSYSLVYSVYEKLKSSFPLLTESQQFEVVPGAGGTQVDFGPAYLPGAVFTGDKSGLSVHVQPQVIVARWTKRPGVIKSEYPRYQALHDSLWKTIEAFRLACGDRFPGIAVVNMSYVNFIPSLNTATFLKTYFSKESQLGAMKNAVQVRKLEAAWSENDDLDVRFAVEQGAAKLPDGVTSGYRLTTAAGLRLGESVTAKSGLEEVHNALQRFFLELISEQAKREWKLQEAANE